MSQTGTESSSGSAASSTDERVLVLDFGSQTAQLIARRVRDQNVFCQIVRHDLSAERIRQLQPKGLILSGGPASVYAPGAPSIDPAIFDLGIPVLGICYGMQITCHTLGGRILPAHSREFGRAPCSQAAASTSPLFQGIPQTFTAWMSHGDQVEMLASDFRSIASTATCPNAAVQHVSRSIYGIQFHPEVTHTEPGGQLLANFVREICGCRWPEKSELR